ncbi:PBP1A family penicillin-binding protein [candidate division WWE3 bacterium]|uniref:PBP1A family penicillin-binding protein n=1 Tax=candidate division WWE3 bacterium TaxID=2053526 RepID=A0A955LJW4_UNCKA|nr:PBP1A family penicillin-binding protein [candidate division WWE3 bacterium]
MDVISKRKLKKWLAGRKKRQSYAMAKRKTKIISIAAGLVLFLTIFGVVSSFVVIAYFSRGLPSPDQLTSRQVAQTTKIYSRDGVLLYEIFGDERRTLVSLEDLPEYLKQATIATEDKDFYTHGGFDIRGIIRGAIRSISGEGLQSGSTITQQVVKNTLLSPERTITRKIKELILSFEMERKYTKNEILQMYFNESPYGGQAWGVGAAAEMYFGKSVSDLTLAEATLIAGLPQSPSFYSPCGAYPENAVERQKIVLASMIRDGYITEEQRDEVLAQELEIVCLGYSKDDIKAPHFVLYVKNELTKMFGEKMVEQGGLKVTTTLDWNAQQVAQEAATTQINSLIAQNANATNSAVITVDPKTGQILAMIGSVDYFDTEHDGNVNAVLSDQLQPGSSIKPITYLTAFTQGYSPSTFVSDIRTCFPGGAGQPDYCPVNWDDKYWGPMSVRKALSNSRNIPAVKMLQAVGMSNMIDMAHKLGITTLNEPERYGLSLTLGGGEVIPYDMAQAYSVFANMGVRNDLTPFLSIEDANGKVLQEYKESSKKVVDPGYIYLLNDVLSDSNSRKTTFGNSLEIGRPLAVKTGTTNDNKDAWTIGYTPQLVTVVWVGNFNKESMNGILGSTGATPIMKNIMTRLLEALPVENWEKPSNVISKDVDALSGLIPQENGGYSTVSEVFVKNSQPTKVDDFHVTVDVCTSDPTKLATEYHIEKGLSEERTFTYLDEILDAWQPYTDEWMDARKKEGYGHAPTEKCEIKIDNKPVDGPIIEFVEPTEISTDEEVIDVKVDVFTTDRITKVEFIWDDVLMLTTNSEPYSAIFDLTQLDESYNTAGEHTISVKAYDSQGGESTAIYTLELIRDTSPTLTPGPDITPLGL